MKKWICLWLSLLLVVVCTACSKQEPVTTTTEELPEGNIYLYYINSTSLELISEHYLLNPQNTEARTIDDILRYMLNEKIGEQSNLMSSAMSMRWCSYDEVKHFVKIKANVANELNDDYVELLTKQAITKTLCQLDYVDHVEFELYDSSTTDNGTMLEKYDEYSFVNAQAEGDFLQKGVITIYFANSTGDRLYEYDKAVEITNNVSLEQLVIESLIAGPMREGFWPTIPEGTTLKKISIKDGVCYVDLSGGFNGPIENCMDVISVYSVVNSLCELPTISKVQFLIDGEKQEFYRENMPLDGMFEFSDEWIIEKEEDSLE